MKPAETTPEDPDLTGADAALRRAAKSALELATRTKTPCYVWQDGRVVDIAAEATEGEGLVAEGPQSSSWGRNADR